jgi:hypothetical protein
MTVPGMSLDAVLAGMRNNADNADNADTREEEEPVSTHASVKRLSNTGHGHVYLRPDGNKARCGGPGVCSECNRDLATYNASHASVPTPTVAREQQLTEVIVDLLGALDRQTFPVGGGMGLRAGMKCGYSLAVMDAMRKARAACFQVRIAEPVDPNDVAQVHEGPVGK